MRKTAAPALAPSPTAAPDTAPAGLKAALQGAIDVAQKEEAAAMLDRLWAAEKLVVKTAPQLAMVMATVRDPFDCEFHLGEVLITQARVECEGRLGCGQILGDEPEKALLLAAVEAITAARIADPSVVLVEFVARMIRRKQAQLSRDGQLAAATAVRFESMKKERVDFGTLV
jgi:alpha-D-ribose 1-methylphosphonate 5-triphosphate synthase subunit PhnG